MGKREIQNLNEEDIRSPRLGRVKAFEGSYGSYVNEVNMV